MLKINPNISIYVQLADYLRIAIFSCQRKPGEKIESIRDMAIELEVNPNTIKRVYQELIDEGLLVTQGTLGNYVTKDEVLIEVRKYNYLREKTRHYLEILSSCHEDISFLYDYMKFEESDRGKKS